MERYNAQAFAKSVRKILIDEYNFSPVMNNKEPELHIIIECDIHHPITYEKKYIFCRIVFKDGDNALHPTGRDPEKTDLTFIVDVEDNLDRELQITCSNGNISENEIIYISDDCLLLQEYAAALEIYSAINRHIRGIEDTINPIQVINIHTSSSKQDEYFLSRNNFLYPY